MKPIWLTVAALGVLSGTGASAQLTSVPHSGQQTIVVTGERPKTAKPAPEELSDWWVAETPHVLMFSKGDPKELTRIAGNLEKLHFLLTVLLNRVDAPDDTLKLGVTMIGDRADFDHLGLHNIRWQQGPYPKEFPTEIYYDPREDGAVMATAHVDQCFELDRGAAIITGEELQEVSPEAIKTPGDLARAATAGPDKGTHCAGNPNKVSVTAEGRLYTTFAQHYLLTYFPAAYPRWYVEGFGEIFSNMDADKPGVIEYGRWPDKYSQVIEKFGRYPVQRVLDGTYLNDKRWTPAFSPYTAWALAHLLFFSNEWKTPLHNYLAAVAQGQSPDRATATLGDPKKLSKELIAYHGRNVPFERLTYPSGQFAPPLLRQLKRSEAAYIQGRLELGARVEASGDARDRWLEDLRKNAARYPNELVAQQLLAEAECRSGHPDPCVAAADRGLSIARGDPVALTWKGYGMALQAAAMPAEERSAPMDAARATIIEANHADTESVLPLLAYYRTFAMTGEAAPDAAVDGVAKSLDEVPSAPTTRLMLGGALLKRSDPIDARRILLPLAKGAFDAPEKPEARQLLTGISTKAVASGDTPTH